LAYYYNALIDAEERNRANPHDPIRSVHGWCMTRARAQRGGLSAPTPPAPPPTAPPVDPDRLTEHAPFEAIEGAFAWLAAQEGALSQEQADRAAHSLCRAFGIDPRARYRTAVPGKKLPCFHAFRCVCRWLASGEVRVEEVLGEFREEVGKHPGGPGPEMSKAVGRGLLRRMVRPRVDRPDAGAPPT
jgi:hypothetical protein